MVKIKLSHSIDEDLIKWLDSEVETKRFSSRSHGIEFCIRTLMREKQNPTNTLDENKNMSEIHPDTVVIYRDEERGPASEIAACPKCGQNNILMINGNGRKCRGCGIRIRFYESGTYRGVKILESGKCPKCGQQNAFMVNGPGIKCLLCDTMIMFYENETGKGVKEVVSNGT